MYEKEENYSEESKYVADILSGMASVAASVSSTTYSIPSTAGFASGIPSTPTLTPNTLANIERTFIELQAVPAGVNASTGQDPHTQSGFVPPIVDPVNSDRSTDAFEYADGDSEWVPGAKRARMEKSNGVSGSTYQLTDATPVRKRRNLKDDKLSPEDDQRRRVRRERNKVAAAKCRQRRVDHTNKLTDETDILESEKDTLEAEIQSLQQQKDQLEFVLQAHRPLCKRDHGAHVMVSSVNNSVAPIALEKVRVKTESLSTMCTMGNATKTIASGLRPMTLNIKKEKPETGPGATTATGIPITTPSGGFYFSMDMDHTGLTPITNGPTSCSSEANRTSSESTAETVNSPTLISL